MASPKSGKYGDVRITSGSQVPECINWKASVKSNNPNFATNVSPGWKRRVGGVLDADLSFDMLDNPAQFFNPQDAVSIDLYTSQNVKWTSMPTLIESYDLEVDIDNGAPLKWATKAAANGTPSPWPPNTSK